MTIKVAIDYDPSIRGTRIWIVDEKPDGEYAFLPTVLSVKKLESFEELEPTFVFSRRDGHEFLQELSQALVRAGFKPSELEASNKEVAAIKYHLEDMRMFAMKAHLPPNVEK